MAPIGDANDKRSFQFWVEQAAPIFSCYFGHTFWTQLLPKIGFVQPAVKHLLIATSNVVEYAALDGVPLDHNAAYQSHYTKAIQATCSSPQVENVLMACLLFACCEFMKGSAAGGLHHIRSGINIIEEWYSSLSNPEVAVSQTARLIVPAVAPIFMSYLDKSPTYGMGDVTVKKSTRIAIIAPNPELPHIAPFPHILGAHHALDGTAHHIARLMDWRRAEHTPSPQQKIQHLLDTWRMNFDQYVQSLTPAKKERYAVAVPLLHVYHTMFSIMFRASSSKSEAIYDQFLKEFMCIVCTYTDFAVLWTGNFPPKFSSGDPGSLDYHMGLIPPLFFTATKCRHPATRMAALNQLGSLRVEENNWTSCTAYMIARKIIQIENKMAIISDRVAHKDERDLIRPVEASITDKRKTQATLSYAVFPYGDDTEPLLHETVDLLDCTSLLSSSKVQWVRICMPLSHLMQGHQLMFPSH
ncbi:hypothetical protein LTS07_011040 [Exophiala sideris]|uniref:Transcription factor domain-containing protein n=1 Tax=Exophiala sideris TaxID=1016849 RepID=A0ABR0IVC3_9EURO|nr:hypothetical protein LTS07_011040 [Exophiala sideris]KAK5025428.1 hypothetical protein LTR13_010505 [Exophiala sideris]KAK5049279.1 hypothetical protein LTR69_011064 [Exophiala sideris]KAK5176952.1 hypothetical protein LTR44_010525 [Eurotiomycetes sp. CCFEE 6388]